MPLRSIPAMMADALAGGYAVGYFESWNLESLQGTLDAAEETRSPVIIGFNGEFMTRDARTAAERLPLYGALGRAAAETAAVPCGFIFNECGQPDQVRAAVDLGFNLVMPIAEEGDPSTFEAFVKELVVCAHERDVAVEAELGILECDLPDDWNERGQFTDPRRAADFASATGIDLLAVSVGNAHIALQGRQRLDVDRLAAIRDATGLPLVLHGGTGIEPDSLQAAISAGVAKVNYGTVLKLRYLDAMRAALASDEPNPHILLGYGGAEDAMTAGRRAVAEAVREKIEILNCEGKG